MQSKKIQKRPSPKQIIRQMETLPKTQNKTLADQYFKGIG